MIASKCGGISTNTSKQRLKRSKLNKHRSNLNCTWVLLLRWESQSKGGGGCDEDLTCKPKVAADDEGRSLLPL